MGSDSDSSSDSDSDPNEEFDEGEEEEIEDNEEGTNPYLNVGPELQRIYSLFPCLIPDPTRRPPKPITSPSQNRGYWTPSLLPKSLKNTGFLESIFQAKPEPKSEYEHLWNYRFKYVSSDGRYYIHSTNILNPDGTCRVKWSKYTADESLQEAQSGEQEQEFEMSLFDFINMIQSEGWEQVELKPFPVK